MRNPARLLASLLALTLVAGSTGCLYFAPTPIPIRTVKAPAVAGVRTLYVFLPGRGGEPEDYFREGLHKIATEAGLAADTIAVDAHLGYYRKRTMVARLKADVIDPARAAGYNRFVLVGISMGGLGALLYAQQQPQDVAAIVLMAPFLGDQPVLDELAAAGGLARWQPKEPLSEADYQRSIWSWLRGYTDSKAQRPPIYLGYGREDRFAQGHGLLAAALPTGHVVTAPGGHDWEPWRQVYRQLLALVPARP